MRRELSDINDLIREEPIKQEVDIEWLKRSINKQQKKEMFRQAIYNYLRKYNKWIDLLSREDIGIMTEWMDTLDRTMFMDEVKHCLETNWGKPIKRIIQNNKSILFTK